MFSRDIAPILEAKCISCHNAEKAKGGYKVHTFEALLRPGKSKKAAVVAGDSAGSELFRRVAAVSEDDRMPQKDEPLTSAQIDLFRAWISAGAKLDRGEPTALLATLIPARPHPSPPAAYRRPLPILALAFTQDGHLAASGYHEVTIWNTNGELSRRITNVTQRVRGIAFSPEGKQMAVAGGQPGRSGEFSLYDFETGDLRTNLLRTGDEVICAAFSLDGKVLGCAGTDNAIHLFKVESLQPMSTIQQHADWVTALAFNTDGTQVASTSRDRTARVYDTASGTLETTYTGQNASLYAVAFLPDGLVASGGRDRMVQLWDVKEGKKKGEITGFEGDVNMLLVTKQSLFTASADGRVTQHSLGDRKLLRTLADSGDSVYALATDPSGRLLASGSYDGTVNLWNIETGGLEKSFIAAPGWTSKR